MALPRSAKKALKPELEAERMKREIDKIMSPDKMSVEDAYRFAASLQEHMEIAVEGLKCDLESQGIDPYELD